ncbi:PP2C family protein-serine/threonine phosphatase [Streptomyces sp. ACA25]|uniref:PP2C family protein-serine/threonine phosphatase n=1 Tax=Streptomyces sp. ACA25 TaxID=3022596 RepID=UPI003FA6D862
MKSSPMARLAGIHLPLSALPQTPAPTDDAEPGFRGPGGVHDRLASWICDLTTLHDLTERLGRTGTLDEALQETLRAGATLAGARRGLLSLSPADGTGPDRLVGLGLDHAELGAIETVPRSSASYARLLDALPGSGEPLTEIAHHNIPHDEGLAPRHREVAARLGFAASYALPLTADGHGRIGAAVWLYDEPGRPDERQRHLLALYLRQATTHLVNRMELTRAHSAVQAVHEGLLPSRLPRLPGVRIAVRHHTRPGGGGDFYDALPLPDDALGFAVGSVTGSGPSAVAAMGRLRAGLRAYAVMEGEDPVAVLSDLELLLRVTEPSRLATALFGYAEPHTRKLIVASAGNPPPLVLGPARAEFAETSLSAPLGMLACWEAPSVEIDLDPGETVLLYTEGLLQRSGEPMDRAFARLQAAAAGAGPAVRDDPEALADHVLHTVLPGTLQPHGAPEDVVLLVVRF